MNLIAKSCNVVVKLDNGTKEFVPECDAEITPLYGMDPDIDTKTYLKLHREGFAAYYDMDHIVSFTFTVPHKEEEL
jgi:hypothetical protein